MPLSNKNRLAPATRKRSALRYLILGMGSAYLAFLVWAILWKCGVPFVGNGAERAVNLLPFMGNTRWELQFNIALFVPLGFYLAAALREWSFVKKLLATALVSLALEVLQYILAVGRSDITDLLMNTLGGLAGIAVFAVLAKLCGRHAPKMALAGCLLLTAFTLYAVVCFIVFGQLYLGRIMIRIA